MTLSEFLQANPLFDSFSRPEIETLEKAMSTSRYPDGHLFVKEGKKGDACYLILEGEVSVTRESKAERGAEQVRMMGPGEMFGLIALIDHGKRAATCKAVGEVTAASLPPTAFDLLFQSDAPIAHHFQFVIARQLARDLRAYNHALLNTLFGRQNEARLLLRTI
ncbi:MAG: cyclic nucleotide-binding domain-containing protein [Acidiferrobacterales bacterium]|nr:cyclic nucleotide-binding domain-containing protein [Acidiferrobacterales bacterium]